MNEIPKGSEAYRKLNPHVFPEMKIPKKRDTVPAGASTDIGHEKNSRVKSCSRHDSEPAPFISTDEAKLNKTERKFLEHLRNPAPGLTLKAAVFVGIQSVTFKLADDCRYTPDFMVRTISGEWIAFEVKGFWRDDAKVKIKVAARMFPIRFVVVTLKKGEWIFEDVKP